LLLTSVGCWFLGFFMFVSFSIHYPLAIIASDMCVLFVDLSNDYVFNPTTDYFIPCTDSFNQSVSDGVNKTRVLQNQLLDLQTNLTLANDTEETA